MLNALEFIGIIENKYTQKKYAEILLLANDNDIDMSMLSQKTVEKYNNLAFYFQKSGAIIQSVNILNFIIERFPNRVVAYLNLADSYLVLHKNSEALSNYQKYIELMKKEGKEHKIPDRVFKIILSLDKNQ